MATRIEIVGRSATQVSVAFYYPVSGPDQEASAVDATRQPAGGAASKLSAQEVTDLQAGTLFELVRGYSIHGFTVAEMKARLEAAWTELQTEALADYKARYSNLHASWDGAIWS